MRRYLIAVVLTALTSLLIVGCQETGATVKSKRDSRYVDAPKYYGVYIGTPTEAAKGQEEAVLQIRPAAMWVMKRNGSYLMGTYQYLSGELELGFRGIDGVEVTALNRIVQEGMQEVAANQAAKKEPDTIEEYYQTVVDKNKAAGRKPATIEELNKYLYEWKAIYWRFTIQEDGYTMKDSERGKGLYVFKKAPSDFVMPENMYSKPSSAQQGPKNLAGA